VIRAHLDKERGLFVQGVKVLSLFFIDEVAKYRDYDREDTLGEYARVFEEEYAKLVEEVFDELALDPAASAYREYLRRDDVRRIHEGYFSIDKKSKRQVDPAVAARGDEAGQSSDADAYDLILKDKERLLSFAEPVRFIFSHSPFARVGTTQRIRNGDAEEERQHHLAAPGDRSRPPALCRPAW